MSLFEIILRVYIVIGIFVGIPLGRIYWKDFRNSNHKSNVILPRSAKIDPNRIIDSFVFLIAWIINIFVYPITILELIIKKYKNKGVLK